MFSSFTHQYPLSKTLRFELKPIAKTLEHIHAKGFLEQDKTLADTYQQLKPILDDFHRVFIHDAMQDSKLTALDDYMQIYLQLKKNNKDDKLKKTLEKCQEKLRLEIVKNFEKTPELKERFKRLFAKELFKNKEKSSDLAEWLMASANDTQDVVERLAWIKLFENFTTYFKGFHNTRKNMYVKDAKHTAIAYRLIHENLPRFIDNIQILMGIKKDYPDLYQQFKQIDKQVITFDDFDVDDVLDVNFYNHLLVQSGITAYNTLLGGKTLENSTKLQGINELINLYSQKHKVKIAKLKPLHKQILSDGLSVSFLPKQFADDAELCDTVNHFYREYVEVFDDLAKLFAKFNDFDMQGIYINHQQLNQVSHSIFADFGLLNRALDFYYIKVVNPEFEAKLSKAKTDPAKEKLFKEKDKFVKSNHSLATLQTVLADYAAHHEDVKQESLIEYFAKLTQNETAIISAIHASFSTIKGFIENEYAVGEVNLPKQKDSLNVKNLKVFLDNILNLVHFIKPLAIKSENTQEKDERFYGEFSPLYEKLVMFSSLYNKVRDYISQKPFSKEKFKLNFGNSTLLNGWDLNKEKDNFGVILLKDGLYYLALLDKNHKKVFENVPKAVSNNTYQKMVYKLLPGPNKMLPKVFFANSNLDYYNPSAELLEKYELGTHKKDDNFSLKDCHALIDFFKASIAKHPEWKEFGFVFSDTSTYQDLSDFYREVEPQGYKVHFTDIDADYIDTLVENGQLYLFQIYNKDFSSKAHGKPNLHTLYLQALFSEVNLTKPIYKLNGEAEIFYRRASLNLSDTTIHQAGELLEPKTNYGNKRTLSYDVIKNKRYTTDKFMLHVPITMNFGVESTGFKSFNHKVNTVLKNTPTNDIRIIGIDRGERHLLYISVIDSHGNVIEQKTLNNIVSNTANGYEVNKDYHELLNKKEQERLQARTDWGHIENIKELKAGYLSHVVHEVVSLMLKHNAIIILEDLNFGFKRGRFKVEKQVYQNFENALIKKLNYVISKDAKDGELGSVINALQLANSFADVKSIGKQTGFIFYVPAWNTSKIDPTTGFVDLLKPRYENITQAQEFFGKFKGIAYNASQDYFEFEFDYGDFGDKANGSQSKWTLCTHGDTRYAYDNATKQTKTVNINQELKALFDKHQIAYVNGENLVSRICQSNDKSLLSGLIYLLKVLLALRYSNAQTNDDFILSPVMNKQGKFFDSRTADNTLPDNADANGAYHIALKGLWALHQIQSADDVDSVNLAISNQEWLQFVQNH